MSRVLVTGASGFIGRHVLEPLLAAGHEVHAVSTSPPADGATGVRWHAGNLLAHPGEVVARVAPERLLHLAWYAEHGRFWTALENVRWVEATLALVRHFAAAGGERAVLAGSCAEYEWGLGGRCVEGQTPLRPATLYGSAKNATREVVEAVADQLDITVGWGRVFFVYGPAEDERRLVASVARALVQGERAATGDGTDRRDFLHVADAGAAFAALIDGDARGAVNVASGESRTLREVTEAVGRAAGRPELLDIGAVPARPGEPAELVADVSRLRDEVGFRPSISLEDGVASTVAWWRDQLRTR